MPLNNIQLHPFLLADLYRNSLIETGEVSNAQETDLNDPVQEKTVVKKIDSLIRDPMAPDSYENRWKYLGDYKKNILFIVRYTNATYLPDEQLNFLTSILGACKLSLGDIAILNLATLPAGVYKTISEQFKSRVTVLFGITPTDFAMPVNFPEFQVQALNNCTFLHTPVLEQLETDKVLKSKLWVCLRRIFGV